ncbi:YncE family protein [Bacteroidota bacterium]
MIKNLIVLAISIIILLSGCDDEKIVGDVIVNQKFLIAVESDSPKLILYDKNDGILSHDIYFEKNGKTLPANISKITEYGGMLFLLMPSDYKIEVIDKETFVSKKTFDFTDDLLEPTDICFANATDAYVCHGNDSVLTLLDIYNLEPARVISVGKNPVSIACAGNQIFVTNQTDNTVSIVDSRTHTQEAVINVTTAPSLAAVSDDFEKALIISLGKGKLTDSQPKTAAKATFIDVKTRKITSSNELGTLKTDPVQQYPVKLVITNNDWAYIQTKTLMLRLDAKRESGINTIYDKYYKDIIYYKLKNQLIIIDDEENEITVTNAENAGKVYSFRINSIISTAYSL